MLQRMRRHLHVHLEKVDVLLGLGKLRLDLFDLVFVLTTVEPEQRLGFLHRHIVFDQAVTRVGSVRRGTSWMVR